ncbi:MG2 domain-containing protein [Chitinophaga costaii]|uniref:MG2 domain-containing protein n=1 Tax=Chitinophaga costaii TaxID=1335309 RepID=UPI0020149CC0|nr:hypothetical protein [Chitinophaga costaii]
MSQRIKRRLYLLTPALCISLLCLFSFLPDDEWPDDITNALQQYANSFPQEKVYLHLDKDYYAAGESIWFKAYLTLQNLPDITARNLYVEVLNKDGVVIVKKMFGAQGSGAPGELVIPANVKSGQYQVRAYTAWMLNFDAHFLFYKNITIFDQSTKTVPTVAPASDYAVQFFPEGGNMITGAASVVAFKAIDQNGLPIAVTGTVKDSKGATVTDIKTQHDGMGQFTITPVAGETYQAVVQAGSGAAKTLPLPQAIGEGASLKIFNRGARIFFQSVSGPNNTDAYNEMLVVASMQQQLVYRAMLNVSEGKISGFIPTQQLPSGILQITLFKKDGTPLSERLAFVRQPDLMNLSVNEGTINHNRRTLNTFTVKLPDTLQAHISVAVTDADQVVENPDHQNIVSNLLMTSDLTGYVHDAGWYFQNTADSTLQGLDLVMMTNGWRRFAWKQILKNQYPSMRFHYEQGIDLGGTAYTTGGKLPMMNGQLDMIIKVPVDSSSFYSKVQVNGLGEFAVDNAHFRDTALIYYKGAGKQAFTDVTVKFNDHFFDYSVPVKTPYPYLLPPPIDNTTLKNFLATAAQGNRINRNIPSMTNQPIQLKEVKVEEKKVRPEEELDKRYTSGMFSGGDGYVFDLTKEANMYQNIFQYLQSRVAGLQITGDLSNPTIQWRGGKPTFYLNEMPTDIQMLSTMSVTDIAMVKVFRPPFMGGFNGANGAIAIYMKRGNEGNSDKPYNSTDGSFKDFAIFKKAGYALVKEFYSPDYAVASPMNTLPDQRLTLYWNPDIRVDPTTRTATISFYNNDFTQHFRVVAEGMAEDGSVGRVSKVF